MASLWISLASDSATEHGSDLDILRQHRKETETQVEGWISEVYELKKGRCNFNTSSKITLKKEQKNFSLHILNSQLEYNKDYILNVS